MDDHEKEFYLEVADIVLTNDEPSGFKVIGDLLIIAKIDYSFHEEPKINIYSVKEYLEVMNSVKLEYLEKWGDMHKNCSIEDLFDVLKNKMIEASKKLQVI
jgi:hypothetical protein